ncbi:four-helix bundle copper-binding protein [Lentibacillus cibarius]|uniref:Four-helix bundle copper-binding protein n=1 Tax=Lentibacillus cibarius TaxID=2583219 RepID=A0A549YIC2_9BACI|nr:four-helix bundle copper-binding protein [Lentibacillus cibarius]TRM11631.1 four-helix bundle copper-binding protein [Lentibacillus cibarius]
MHYAMAHHNQNNMDQQQMVNIIQDCEATCEYTKYCILEMDGSNHRKEQLRLLEDCADICTLTAKCIARCSNFSKSIASLCAQICDTCGNHCLQHPDELSQHCGRICLQCAQACRYFAIST